MTDLVEALTTDRGTLYQGDCLQMLAGMADESVDVVFADPPFNLAKDYGSGINDSLTDHAYLEWCRTWIRECSRVLVPGGAFWLYNLPRWNIQLGCMMAEAGLDFRHWVAVEMKMVLPIRGKLYPSHYSLLYYTKGKPRVFERPRVPIQLCRHCGGEVKNYGGHRGKMNPLGVNVSDVWTDITPVRHKKTKTRAANQLNERMLERIIGISSSEGDLVFDPFGGSGTTCVVAERMNRRWVGVELGEVGPIIDRFGGEGAA